MDYRRCFGLRAPRPMGDSTMLAPQLENYSLFATPFLDLNKKISKVIDEMQEDVKNQSEEEITARKTRKGSKTSTKMEDIQKISDDKTSQVDADFGIVLNVVTVKPEQLTITIGKGNEIEVKVKQDKVLSEFGSIPFSRNCTYKYQLPDGVDKNSLKVLRTSDDFLIILQGDQLREDLLEKSIVVAEELAESSGKDIDPPVEATESKDADGKAKSVPETSKPEEANQKKPSKSTEKAKTKTSQTDTGDLPPAGEGTVLTPVQVTRMLRPGMDIFMLRKYMIDLESYVSTARKFIENASFISHSSKTAERCIRFLAKLHADKFYEDPNLKDDVKRKMKPREPSPDSGYTSAPYPSDDSKELSQHDQKQDSGDIRPNPQSTLKKDNPNLSTMLWVPPKE